jgi:hypothetical protein
MGLPVMFYVFTGLKIDSFSGVCFFEKILPYEKSVNNVAGSKMKSVQFNLHAFFLLLYRIKKVLLGRLIYFHFCRMRETAVGPCFYSVRFVTTSLVKLACSVFEKILLVQFD